MSIKEIKKRTTESTVKTALVLVGVGVIGLLGLTLGTEFAYAGCTCERQVSDTVNGFEQQNTEGHTGLVVLRPQHPHWIEPDVALDDVMRKNAQHAVDSGLWNTEVTKQRQALAKWADEPTFPVVRPMALASYVEVKPTGITTETFNKSFPKGTFDGIARWYVFFDERNDVQRRFVAQWFKSEDVVNLNAEVRPVVTGGSVKRAYALLKTRVWADQGSVLTRRLGLKHWPAVVKLSPTEIVTWVPALNYDGVPLDQLPDVLGLRRETKVGDS